MNFSEIIIYNGPLLTCSLKSGQGYKICMFSFWFPHDHFLEYGSVTENLIYFPLNLKFHHDDSLDASNISKMSRFQKRAVW